MAQYGGNGAYSATGVAPGIGSIPAAAVAGGVDSKPKMPEGQGWGDFLTQTMSDPQTLAFMLALGNSLSQRRPGQGPMNQLSEGVMRGFGMMGLMAQQRQQREAQQQEMALKERSAANDEKRTKIAETGATSEAQYRQQSLGLEKDKLTQDASAQERQDKIMLARLGIDQAQYAASKANMEKQLDVLKSQAKNQEDKNKIDTYGAMMRGIDAQLKGIDANTDLTPEQRSTAVRDALMNAQRIGNMILPGIIPSVMTGEDANNAANPNAAAAVGRARDKARGDAANALSLQSPEALPSSGGGGTVPPQAATQPNPTVATSAPPAASEGPLISQGRPGEKAPPGMVPSQAPLEVAKQIANDPTARPEHVAAAISALSPYLAQNPQDATATQTLSQLMLKQQAMGMQ